MSSREIPPLASTRVAVIEAIRRFEVEVRRSPELAGRLSHMHCWYAVAGSDGRWRFGPSKFVGYEGLNADTYLELSRRGLHGQTTEAWLRGKRWFAELGPSSDRYRRVRQDLDRFLGRYGKAPRRGVRICVRSDA